MRMVVFGLGQQVMVIVINFEGKSSLSEIPELDGLVMASHETILLVGVVINIDNIFGSRPIDHIFLSTSIQIYVLLFLSRTLT